jgi:uncharacterized damage-inducible protein DinB
VITDIRSFLRFFDAVHRRTVRDVSALPQEAQSWKPPAGEGEGAWGAPDIVRHIAEGRLFFASAFLGRGWVWDPWPEPLDRREDWTSALERSWERFAEAMGDADPDLLGRRVELIGQPDTTVSGWRILMMMTEHEVHHRSQLATYAGMNGWPVHQIFGRTNEWVLGQREAEMQRRTE